MVSLVSPFLEREIGGLIGVQLISQKTSEPVLIYLVGQVYMYKLNETGIYFLCVLIKALFVIFVTEVRLTVCDFQSKRMVDLIL